MGDDWSDEPVQERGKQLIVHSQRPFNAETPSEALSQMITPMRLFYRRTHKPIPRLCAAGYLVQVDGEHPLRLADVESAARDVCVTLMCTGNRRSDFNEIETTMGISWGSGSISTARWSGAWLHELRPVSGRFITFEGQDGYTVSVPADTRVLLATQMNGQALPRDHGFPLRAIVPGFVGARSVKWLRRIRFADEEVDNQYQTGLAYKQLPTSVRELIPSVSAMVRALPPIDVVPVLSAVTKPVADHTFLVGEPMQLAGYAFSGGGRAIIRVELSCDDGLSWQVADTLERADDTQTTRSGSPWAWCIWRHTTDATPETTSVLCRAVDDQYNQQPSDVSSLWNLRGLLNVSWGRCPVRVKPISKL